MDLKRINKQIAEAAAKLPVALCKSDPKSLDLTSITTLQQGVTSSANLIESVNTAIKLLIEDNQNLRNEVAELKGEQGKPDIRPQSTPKDNDKDDKNDDDDNDDTSTQDSPNNKKTEISSEKERNSDKDKPVKKRRTNEEITITKTEIIVLDPSVLPADAVFKGYQTYLVQDIVFELNNIEYKREEYYSASENRTYVAEIPIMCNGSHFGPNVRAIILDLYNHCNMTQPAIHSFLTNTCGIKIANSTISRLLIDNVDIFHQEKTDIVMAGFAATNYEHLDDTGARVNGQNWYVHALCSPYFSAYFTREHKDRLTILKILSQEMVCHIFNEDTYKLMNTMEVSDKTMLLLQSVLPQKIITTDELTEILQQLFPESHATSKKHIIEASAIIWYRQLPHAIQIMVCDDAPQFKQITEIIALCWVHAARHYKKLHPIIPEHKQLTDDFITSLWEYYHKLKNYKANPQSDMVAVLSAEFDTLFSIVTGYNELDERIAKTRSQKESLLVVLEHPEVPLHNNPAELAARVQARKRDISLHTINTKGTEAKDTMMTVVHTAIKLGVSAFDYIKDRISGNMQMLSLAELIRMKASFAPSG